MRVFIVMQEDDYNKNDKLVVIYDNKESADKRVEKEIRKHSHLAGTDHEKRFYYYAYKVQEKQKMNLIDSRKALP